MAFSEFRKQESGISLEEAFMTVISSYYKWVEFDVSQVNQDFVKESKFFEQVSPALGSSYSQAIASV
jgi:hypothetical protein